MLSFFFLFVHVIKIFWRNIAIVFSSGCPSPHSSCRASNSCMNPIKSSSEYASQTLHDTSIFLRNRFKFISRECSPTQPNTITLLRLKRNPGFTSLSRFSVNRERAATSTRSENNYANYPLRKITRWMSAKKSFGHGQDTAVASDPACVTQRRRWRSLCNVSQAVEQ